MNLNSVNTSSASSSSTPLVESSQEVRETLSQVRDALAHSGESSQTWGGWFGESWTWLVGGGAAVAASVTGIFTWQSSNGSTELAEIPLPGTADTDVSLGTPANSPATRKRRPLPRRGTRISPFEAHKKSQAVNKKRAGVEEKTEDIDMKLQSHKKSTQTSPRSAASSAGSSGPGMGFTLPPGAMDRARLKAVSPRLPEKV